MLGSISPRLQGALSMSSPLRSLFFTAVVVVGVAIGGCTTLLGDYTVSDTSTDGSTADVGTSDVTLPADGGQDTGATDDGATADVNDASDAPGCGANELFCNAMCVAQDAKNCGTCGHDCTRLPHVSGAGVTCNGGRCVVPATACAPGFAHCTSNPDDGCEADLSGGAHCGSCSTVCSGSTPVCSAIGGDAGAGFACSSGCPASTPTLCGASCVDLTSNAQHCANCANSCPTVTNGQPACANSTCGFTCNNGYHACNGGCFADSDVAHCGAACSTCSTPVNGSPTCAGGACTFSCNANYSPCGNTCQNLATDPNNCGLCGKVCALANATATCGTGLCAVSACNAGYGNCNNASGDGCEVNVSVDRNNCGTCGFVCGASFNCTSGSCTCGGALPNLCAGACVNYQTDANNCGSCGHSCTGTSCSAGLCVPVVLAQSPNVAQPAGIANDGGYVFWTNYANPGSVMRVTGTGGGLLTLTSGQVFPQYIVAHGGTVYFLNENAGAGGILKSMTNTGGGLSALASAGSGFPSGLAFDQVSGNRLFWGNDVSGTTNRFRFDLPSTNTLIHTGSQMSGLAADNLGDYWTEPSNSRVVGQPNGQGASVFAGNLVNPAGIVANSGSIYYAERGSGANGAIWKEPSAGGTQTKLASNLTSPVYIDTDGVSVYWSDQNDGAIYRVPVGGGTVVTIAKGAGIGQLTVDATYVYYTNTTNAQILRAPK
jgi:hypothetical protein